MGQFTEISKQLEETKISYFKINEANIKLKKDNQRLKKEAESYKEEKEIAENEYVMHLLY
jgi:hypothetical protein